MQDWREFRLTILINARPEDILAKWLTSGGLKWWFLKDAKFFGPDGRELGDDEVCWAGCTYQWTWEEMSAETSSVRAVGADHAEFGWVGDRDSFRVQVSEMDGRCLLELSERHESPDEDKRRECWIDCSMGWAFWMVNLKSLMEGGIDLRERDPKLKGLINV